MFLDSKFIKEYIVLRTNAKTVSDLVHVCPNVILINDCCTRCRCIQTYIYIYTCEFATMKSATSVCVHMYIPVSNEMVLVFPAPLWPRRAVI